MSGDEGDGFDAGPFSMLSVSALENHIEAIRIGDRVYAAICWDRGTTVTQLMIFCRGILGWNVRQELVLRDFMGGDQVVHEGDWIIMVSRTEYRIMRTEREDASLFALMPNVPVSTPEARLARIAQAHKKDVDEHGGTHGLCVECYQSWGENGCPTYVWATTDRDPINTWDPADDETPGGVEDET